MNTSKSKKTILVSAVLAASMAASSLSAFAAYSDVSSDSWYATYVNFMTNKGYMSGYPDGTFMPEQYITRAEVAKVMVNIVEDVRSTTLTPSSQTMSDVSDSAWYATYMKKAVGAGIFTGDAGTVNFRPEEYITRQEASAVVFRALNLDSIDTATVSFADAADIADWAYNFVATMAYDGIISGDSDNNFRPLNNITRAEIAKIVQLSYEAATVTNNTISTNGNNLSSVTGISSTSTSSGSSSSSGGSGSGSHATVAPKTTASPDPDATATPEPTATASPDPEATATPTPVPTLAPEVVEEVAEQAQTILDEAGTTVEEVATVVETIVADPEAASTTLTNATVLQILAAYNSSVANGDGAVTEYSIVSTSEIEAAQAAAEADAEKEAVYAPVYEYMLGVCSEIFEAYADEVDNLTATTSIIQVVNLTGDEIISSVTENGSCEAARSELVSYVKNDIKNILTGKLGEEIAQNVEANVRAFALAMFSDPEYQAVIDNSSDLQDVTLRWAYKYAGEEVGSDDAYYDSLTDTNYYVIPTE